MRALGFIGARSAGLELAVLAFKDEPVRSRMAHATDPLNQGRLGFEEGELVMAISWYRHDGWILVLPRSE